MTLHIPLSDMHIMIIIRYWAIAYSHQAPHSFVYREIGDEVTTFILGQNRLCILGFVDFITIT